MIELLFVACLSSSPDHCREHSLLFSDVTPMQCLMAAQPELAKWVDAHPNARILKWRCRAVSLSERDA